MSHLGNRGKDIGEIERVELVAHDGAEGPEQQHQAEQEAPVPHPVHEKRLLAGRGRRLLLEEEADEQEGAKADSLPAYKHQQVVVRHHQKQHGEREQVEPGEVAGEQVVLGHVADAVDVDQEADAGNHQHHRHGERIDAQRHRRLEAARADPLPEVGFEGALTRRLRLELLERPGRDRERRQDDQRPHPLHETFAEPRPQEAVEQHPDERKQEDKPDHVASLRALGVRC